MLVDRWFRTAHDAHLNPRVGRPGKASSPHRWWSSLQSFPPLLESVGPRVQCNMFVDGKRMHTWKQVDHPISVSSRYSNKFKNTLEDPTGLCIYIYVCVCAHLKNNININTYIMYFYIYLYQNLIITSSGNSFRSSWAAHPSCPLHSPLDSWIIQFLPSVIASSDPLVINVAIGNPPLNSWENHLSFSNRRIFPSCLITKGYWRSFFERDSKSRFTPKI